jgi:perosamine synthetase
MISKYKKSIRFFKKSFPDKSIISLHEPVFFGNEKKYLIESIDSTFVSSVGKFVDKFESNLSHFTGSEHCVAVVNGTSALHVILKLIGVESDDEVITQSLTFVATINSIRYLNANPVFIDVDKDSMGMSTHALQNFLDEFAEIREEGTFNKKTGKKISACLPMHTFGFIGQIDRIISICKKWNIPVAEDAAEALGSSYKGKSAGTFGNMGAFSFNGNKIITSGGGGAIITNNRTLGIKAKHITTTAKLKHEWEFVHDQEAYNYRMPNINASLAVAQLENFEKIKTNKKILYEEYKNFFLKTGIELFKIPKHNDWNYWLMSIILNDKKERDLFLKTTNHFKVKTRPIWHLMHKLSMFEKFQSDSQKNAVFLYNRIVNIPSGARL